MRKIEKAKDYSEFKRFDKPYSFEDSQKAKKQGLNLDDWNDYKNYFELEEYAKEEKQ